MPADERYVRQVGLLMRALPLVTEEKCFALKGGTAINLFVRSLPRLSVDIDLAYLPAHRGTTGAGQAGTGTRVRAGTRGPGGNARRSLEDLVRTRKEMVAEIVGRMSEEHRAFLASFESGDPDWSLLGVPQAKTLPAVRWRLMNVARLDAGRRADQVGRLERALAGTIGTEVREVARRARRGYGGAREGSRDERY